MVRYACGLVLQRDVGALAALAKRHGVVSMIDNSWASPYFQRPLTLGVDLVIHSASKYLGGHSDVVAGIRPERQRTQAQLQALGDIALGRDGDGGG